MAGTTRIPKVEVPERDDMEYAEAMSETPPRVTDDLFARLLAQLGAPAMVELTAWVGYATSA